MSTITELKASLGQIFSMVPEDSVGRATAATQQAITETERALAAATQTTEGANDDEAESIRSSLMALLAMLQQAGQTLAGGMQTAQQSKNHVENYRRRL